MEEPNEPAAGDPDTEPTTERDDVAIRRRRALERLGKMAIYSTPLVVGLLSSDAWSESG
jgi:hypothetical protein